jgi:CRP/FNR family cyclic AMP-dependent transcriptional regulator
MDLRAFSIFSELPEDQLEEVRRAIRIRHFERHDVVCRKDEPADGLYLLFSGQLQVMDVAENGQEVGLNLIKPGAFFGELSVVDDRPRAAHVVALEASSVGVLPQVAARELFYQRPRTAEAMMRHLTALVRSMTDFRVLLALPSAFQRVHAILHQLGRPMPGGLVVIQPLPKQHEVAIMVNTSRETVSRAIAQLVAEGVVEKDYRRLIVRKPARLRELAKKAELLGHGVPSVEPANRHPSFDPDS